MREKLTTFKFDPALLIVLTFMLSFPCFGNAENSVLSGEFDGSEPRTRNLLGIPTSCGSFHRYQEIPIEVSESGDYLVYDAFSVFGINATVSIYEGSFDPDNPQENVVPVGDPSGAFNNLGRVSLDSGVEYIVVISDTCPRKQDELIQIRGTPSQILPPPILCPQGEEEPVPVEPPFDPVHMGLIRDEAAWALVFTGPGTVESDNRVEVPGFTMGTFGSVDPVIDSDCGNSGYQQSGPVQFSKSGTYYYADVLRGDAVDTCLQVYTAPINTNNPDTNRIAVFDNAGAVDLEAGQNYYFVVQPVSEQNNGDFLYVFAPPAPFRLNPAMSGSWFNPEAPGQGFFLDFFDRLNLVFLSWFTYDLSRPDDEVEAQIGDPGHRWLTALGPFNDGHAELDVEVTVGGVFDSGQPMPTQSPGGTITLDFDNCLCGEIAYDLGGGGPSGVVPVQRIAFDSFDLCEAYYRAPGVLGQL